MIECFFEHHHDHEGDDHGHSHGHAHAPNLFGLSHGHSHTHQDQDMRIENGQVIVTPAQIDLKVENGKKQLNRTLRFKKFLKSIYDKFE